jgi:cysteinyl-tRNA synthetase
MQRTVSIAVLGLALTAGLSAPSLAQLQKDRPPPSVEPLRELLSRARSWAYQLQGLKVPELARSTYDILVLDPGSGDGTQGLKPAEIGRLKRKPDGSRRLVLAYLNIGEAENYRAYWRASWATAPPEWLGGGNVRWKGDHRVRHWHPDWQAIVFGSRASVVGRVIGQGFDGVYMDRVDVWQFWCGERPTALEDMVAFVNGISRWAKALKPGFLIVPQNAEELLQSPHYRAAIDGLGKEDLLFGDRGNDVANLDTRIARSEMLLALARRDGLPVLAVEYARRSENHARAREHHGRLGHVLYFGPRSLAYLGQTGPPHAEDGDSEPYLATQGPLGCGR